MQNGHLVWESGGARYVALPKDRRNAFKCYGCHFSFTPGPRRLCPRDKGGNMLCEFGHGFVFRRIGQPEHAAEKQETPGAAAVQLMLIKEDMT